ncbi:MAG: glycosyltransferase family 2 protein [Janthinobacterium lividum]
MPLDQHARCTVCIPTYNQAEYLRAAVRSVAAQTAPVRLLISNDGSPDNTAEVVAELQREYRFDAVHHAVNRGISANLQWMMRQPETPLLMRLDSDDLLHPDYVGVLAELLDRYPQAGYAHCAIQEIDATGQPLKQRRLGRLEEFQDADVTLRKLVNGYQVAANVLLFRRDALASVDFGAGSADVNFVEDYDLSVRLADMGWGNVYSREVLASYRMWQASSRPKAGRKLTEVRGVANIFSGSLTTAFERRGWSLQPLKKRRVALALANADILDQASFAADEREAMTTALLALGGDRRLRWALGEDVIARAIRWAVQASGSAKQQTKQVIKRVLWRR